MRHHTRIAKRALAEADDEVRELQAQIHRHRRTGNAAGVLERELRDAKGRQLAARGRVRAQLRLEEVA
jgi:hypothetical protein